MDISTVICTEANGKSFNELLPEYHTSGKVNDELLALFEKINKTDDVLQAIKKDPAVLEAQITVNYKETKNVDTAFNRDSRSGARNDVLENEPRGSFDNIMESHQEALRSLTRYQYDFLLELADTLRKQRLSVQRNFECAFCKNNGQPLSWYSSHALKDWRGRVLCPVLRSYRCFICGATGNRAHTIKYCPRRIY